jgi:hypothetical protein
MSNTKLNADQQIELMRLAMVNDKLYYNVGTGITVVINEPFAYSNTVRVATSVSSPDEVSFKFYVGAYRALVNLANGQFIVLPRPESLDELGEMLAGIVD